MAEWLVTLRLAAAADNRATADKITVFVDTAMAEACDADLEDPVAGFDGIWGNAEVVMVPPGEHMVMVSKRDLDALTNCYENESCDQQDDDRVRRMRSLLAGWTPGPWRFTRQPDGEQTDA